MCVRVVWGGWALARAAASGAAARVAREAPSNDVALSTGGSRLAIESRMASCRAKCRLLSDSGGRVGHWSASVRRRISRVVGGASRGRTSSMGFRSL
eukprot:4321527-Prymnesium_polylepis.1